MNEIFDINFELETKQFVPTKNASLESIPLHALFDNKEFRFITKEFNDEMADIASELQEIFMNYEVPLVTVFNGDIEEVSIIFERINSTGKTLTIFDLMVAATWAENFDLRDEIKLLQEELNDMDLNVTILEYIDYSQPIKVKCNKCEYEWFSKGVNLTQGHSCPNCPSSNFEKECSNILEDLGFKFTRQEWFDDCRDKNPLPFDFYLSDFNILIECDGEGHYKPIPYGSMTEEEAKINLLKVQKHDNIKTIYCKNNNIPLIRIPYWERDNMEYFLWDELVKFGVIEEINKIVV
jgi:predicted Zn-ribbon and HTH transcriptional regulator